MNAARPAVRVRKTPGRGAANRSAAFAGALSMGSSADLFERGGDSAIWPRSRDSASLGMEPRESRNGIGSARSRRQAFGVGCRRVGTAALPFRSMAGRGALAGRARLQ